MDVKAVSDRISAWIFEQVSDACAAGVVVGLSGGVDSTIVAALAERGGIEVRGMILPCESDKRDADDARLVADEYCITCCFGDIFPAFEEMQTALDDGFRRDRLALGNLKARLRMAALYYEANRSNALVCGTTNRTEFVLGYFTKHGDGAADIEPIADVWKTDVFDLARYLGVPQCIIDKPPSAGLWEGQTDEGEMGMTYAEVDASIKRLGDGVADGGIDARVYRMIHASHHKRTEAPVCRLEE